VNVMMLRGFLRWSVAVLVICVGLSSGAGGGEMPGGEALWVAGAGGAFKVSDPGGEFLLNVGEGQEVRAVAVDAQRATAWIWAGRALRAYSFQGEPRLSVSMALPDAEQAELAVYPMDGSVWLAVGGELRSVSAAGQALRVFQADGRVESLAVAGDVLWVATRRSVTAHDAVSGGLVRTLVSEPSSSLRAIDAGQGGEVWVAGSDRLRRYSAGGDPAVSVSMAGLLHVAAAADGGAWAAGAKELVRIGPAGERLFSVQPFAGRGVIVDLAADPKDGGVWVASEDELARMSASGGVTRAADLPAPVHIRDLALYSDVVPPEIEIRTPAAGALLSNRLPQVEVAWQDVGTGIDPRSLDVRVDGTVLTCQAGETGAVCALQAPLADGEHGVTAVVDDLAGNPSEPASLRFVVDATPPVIHLDRPVDGQETGEREQVFAGSLSEPASLTLNGAPVELSGLSFLHGPVLLEEGGNAFVLNATDPAGNRSELTLTVTLRTAPPDPSPPDPATVAPPQDPTIASDIADGTAFLYTGSRPVQTGVAAGTIDPKRVAILRGRVISREGEPLAGARVSISGHPELGSTLSRADGMYDLAVNGGGTLILQLEKEGWLPAQRAVETPWRDFVPVEDVALVAYDPEATAIASGLPAIQVARGSLVSDQDGSRRTTLLFPESTGAEMVMPDGSRTALATMTVRMTEYTVGPRGLAAMPGPLPSGVAYTYAVELSADEAVAAGAKSVVFSKPVLHYVENFLGFPVGGIVPVGYYDRTLGAWLASGNGRVVKVLSIADGAALLDVTGSGLPASDAALQALGITEAERRQLAELYAPGQSLWRVPIPHFTPWDCNWPYGPPDDAKAPQQPEPETDEPEDEPCEQGGSIIECQNQTLGESLPITGTPYTLNYRSDRVPGRKGNHSIRIALSGSSVPASLKRIELEIAVVGRLVSASFPREPNQSYVFTWDGKDIYGRTLYGRQPVTVGIGYVYDAIYQTPANLDQSWAQLSGVPVTGSRVRQEITLWQKSERTIGSWSNPPANLGGWSISPQHYYDEGGAYLFLGSGERVHAGVANQAISTVAGQLAGGFGGDGGPATAARFDFPQGIDIGPDGSLYIADTSNRRVRRVSPGGIITTFAGIGNGPCHTYCGNGVPATQARLYNPYDVAVAPDGTVYIADYDAVDKVDRNGIISTIYNYQQGASVVYGIDVDQEGNLYIADYGRAQVVRIDPGNRLTLVAGTGTRGFGGDGGPARQARLYYPYDVAVDRNGNVYINDYWNGRVRRVSPDGIIRTVAGNGTPCGFSGDGGSATLAALCNFRQLAVDSDGSLYIADNGRIRQVIPEGLITTVAGSGNWGDKGDGGPATAAEFRQTNGVAVDPDGNLYVLDSQNNRVRKVGFALPGYSRQTVTVASRSGQEFFYFDDAGRHLKTVDTRTGHAVHEFFYDAAGRLTSLRDADGDVTRIERNASGQALAVVSADGIRTELTSDANGYLASVRNPAGETVRLSTTSEGLLTALTDPRNGIHTFSYDTLGRLARDENPAGGFQSLLRTVGASGYQVNILSAEGRTRSFLADDLSTGDRRMTVRLPSGAQTVTLARTDGTFQASSPDGTVVTSTLRPDPRFGMVAAFPESVQVRTPAGRSATVNRTVTATLDDPLNPLSLRRLQETVVRNGKTSSSVFDVPERRLTFTTPAGRQRLLGVDDKGRILSASMGGLEPVALTYDGRGRLASVLQGTGDAQRVLHLSYGADGRLASMTDPLNRTVSFEYDEAGRLIRQLQPDGGEIRTSHDAAGNPVTVALPGRPAHAFAWSPINLLQEYTPPAADGGEVRTRYEHDADGVLQSILRPDGREIALDRDAAGRVIGLETSRGRRSYSYLPSGRLGGITTPEGESLGFTYDGFLTTRATWTGPVSGRLDFGYDNDFRATSLTVLGTPAVSFAYDNDNLLVQAGSMTLARDTRNGLLTATTSGRVTTAQTYNGFGEPATIEARVDAAPVLSTRYTRDRLGRIVQKEETVDGTTETLAYTYDPAGRLTRVEKGGALLSRYEYDANGNRRLRETPGGTETADYDAQDRLLRYGNTAFTYTANGELASRTQGGQTVAYEYDELGNLGGVTLADGIRIDYVMDGRSRRIGKRVNGTLVQGFLYKDQLEPVAELDGAGAVSAVFVYGSRLNVPDLMLKGGRTYRILADHLGSPRLVIDTGTGAVAQRMDYDEHGKVILDTNPRFQPFGFAGGLYDPQTGLVRFGARDYDPEVGRWTAKDPIGFAGREGNLYGYVSNDPVNFVDDSGLMKLPADPSGLPSEWSKDPNHRNPGGERYIGPEGDILEWHRGKPGEPGAQGRDHWHHYPGGEGQRHRPLEPGTEIPDPVPSPGPSCKMVDMPEIDIPEFEMPTIPDEIAVPLGIGIIVGTIVEDVLSGGTGIADDPVTLTYGLSLVLGGGGR
jgi:RHS repeat-associated protein